MLKPEGKGEDLLAVILFLGTLFSCMNTCSVWFLFVLVLNLPLISLRYLLRAVIWFDTYMVKAVPQCWCLAFPGCYFISQTVFSFPFFLFYRRTVPFPPKKPNMTIQDPHQQIKKSKRIGYSLWLHQIRLIFFFFYEIHCPHSCSESC